LAATAIALSAAWGGLAVVAARVIFLAPYDRSILPLVKAVGERRLIKPRLTGGFRYGPLVEETRRGLTQA
jgi:hypothetical protein